jgi:hypothetical protein
MSCAAIDGTCSQPARSRLPGPREVQQPAGIRRERPLGNPVREKCPVWRAICSSSCEARTSAEQRDSGSLIGFCTDRFRASSRLTPIQHNSSQIAARASPSFQGLVHVRTSEGLEAACSDGRAPPVMLILDKTWATISRGAGSIDTTMGFSSGPGSSSASY